MTETLMQPRPDALPDPERDAELYADVTTKRLIAWIVDTLAIAAIMLLLVPLTAFVALFFWPVLWLMVSFVYRAAGMARHSATPGMRLAGIEFRDRDCARLDTGTAVAHTLLYNVAVSTFFLQALSVALMLGSPRRQGLGDRLLGTAALNRSALA